MSAPSYTPQLRPLSVGEVLDAGFRLVRHRFGVLALCTLVFAVPIAILATFVEASTNDVAFDFSTSALTDGSSEAAVGARIAQILQQLLMVLAIGACFKALSAAYLGERAGAGESLRFFAPRVAPLIVAWFVASLAVFVGLFAIIIGAIFLLVRFSMTFPAVVVERRGPMKAIGRSWKLVSGHWWRTFAVLAVAWLLTLVIGLVGGAVLGGALGATETGNEVLAATLFTLLTIGLAIVTYPLIAAVVTVQYYDLRVRNEGFDLKLLAEGVGADSSRFSATPERPPESVAPPAVT